MQIFPNGYFGQGSGPVLFNSLECVGNEFISANCSSNLPLYSSSHSTDVGIKCMNEGMQYK